VAERARVAVALVFALNGLVFASWVSRLPAVREALGLSTGQLGLLLLCVSIGSVLGLPTSGPLVARFGPSKTVLGGASLVAAGLLLVSTGVGSASVPLTGVGLVLTGLGVGSWDVAMNVEGADVERRLARTLMPRFHAGFSVGTVAGALVGAAAAAVGLPVQVQLGRHRRASSSPSQSACGRSCRSAAALRRAAGAARLAGLARAAHAARRCPRPVLRLRRGHRQRLARHRARRRARHLRRPSGRSASLLRRRHDGVAHRRRSLLTRYGRTAVLRATGAGVGGRLLLVVLSSALPVVLLGRLLWGAGAALGFPDGMSAAADDEVGAAVRVSVVSSIGYTAFLAGPPLVGLLAEPERLGVLRALLVVLVALLVGAAAARSAAPLPEPRAVPAVR
jgi:MFS family permease